MLLLLITCDTFSVNTPRPEKYPLLAKRILDTTSQEKKKVCARERDEGKLLR
jgi:hypothetical protein